MIYLKGCVCVKSLQLCPTLCNPMYCSPPGSSFHGLLQVKIQEWIALPSSRQSSQPRDRTQVSHTAGGFFTIRKAPKHWRGQPIPFPGDLPDPGIKSGSPALQVDSLPAELSEKLKMRVWKVLNDPQTLLSPSINEKDQNKYLYAWSIGFDFLTRVTKMLLKISAISALT